MMNSASDMGLLIDQIDRYLTTFPTESTRLAPLLNMTANMRLLDRSTLPGHVTASGIVVDDRKMLMVFHPHLEKWLQPGGHIEPGESPLEAAAREVSEETGLLIQMDPWHQKHLMPFDIDVHRIPENRKTQEAEHWHFDFRYLLKTASVEAERSGEHHSAWIDIGVIEEAGLAILVAKLHDINIY